jgi:vacuolar-type H+-ATPase subunit H
VTDFSGSGASPPVANGAPDGRPLGHRRVIETAPAPAAITDVAQYDYEPLLRALGDQCRRVLLAAHTEADRVRTDAREEAHRIVTEARHEETTILERAAAKQASLYHEVKVEIEGRLRELDEQRDVILRRAQADAEDLRLEAARTAEPPPAVEPGGRNPVDDRRSAPSPRPPRTHDHTSGASAELEGLLAELNADEHAPKPAGARDEPRTLPEHGDERRWRRFWRRDS